jgi:hypothetical protein
VAFRRKSFLEAQSLGDSVILGDLAVRSWRLLGSRRHVDMYQQSSSRLFIIMKLYFKLSDKMNELCIRYPTEWYNSRTYAGKKYEMLQFRKMRVLKRAREYVRS